MKKFLLHVLIFSSFGLVANAQWSGNPLVGTSVATASPTTTKLGNVAVSDGANGMFTAWVDNRNATVPAIYIQRILADGTLKFGTEVVLSNASGATSSNKSNLTIAADGAGGAICVWQDSRNRTAVLSNDDIYGQRIDPNGNVLWTANGVRLTVSDNSISNKISPVVDLVSATEAMVVFGDSRSGSSDLFAQKLLLSTGVPQWPADVSVHGSQPNTQTSQSILADGLGGAFIVWQDPRVATNNSDIYAQRITNAGALSWSASGVVVSNAANNQLTPQFISDNAGGIVITWSDQRGAIGDGNIYAQRLDGTGTPQWTANGVAVGVFNNNQSNPYIVNAGSNFIIAWSDQRVAINDRNIFAQSINSAGALQWMPASTVQTDGIAITQATGNQPSSSTQSGIQILPDGSSGAVIIWDDARINTSSLDMYAQRINSAGVVQWTTDGVAVSTATGIQQGPAAVMRADGSSIITWRDGRNGTSNTALYAARLQPTGVLPIRSIVLNAIVKNTTVDIKWTTLDESNTDFFVIEKSSDGVRYSSIGSVKAKGTGNGTYLINDSKPVKGSNFYRVKIVDINAAYSYSSVIQSLFAGPANASIVLYPNPVQDRAVLQLVNVPKGNYTMIVYNLSGSTILQQALVVPSEFSTIPLSLSGIPSGSYMIQLVNSKAVVQTIRLQKQ